MAPAARAWLEQFARAHALPEPPLNLSSALGHRHRARLAVRGRATNPRIGLFQAGSHRIVATPHCAVHHPAINAAAEDLREAIRETGVAPYADDTHRGAIRYVQLAVERPTGRLQAVLVGRGASPDCLGELPAAFAARLGPRLQGLFYNAQPDRTNAVLGETTIALAGEPALHERIGGVDVFFPPTAFGQNHLPLFDRAVERIQTLVPAAAQVVELYCGVGAIGLGLLARGASVELNERGHGGLEGLALGLAVRPAAEQARARILEGPAEAHAERAAGAEVVIVDPPRRGLDRGLLEVLAATPPERLVYLACDRTSLARDLEVLMASGRLAPRGLEAFDFFPFTDHVESLVWLDRTR
ncbi:MAG: class I SAM-dependent RNA methyltransferase [Deltaproteobacteria bacterium]|nr:class I SAM-dependent RNA methyltransferase [Deltaproteobacteria bacterium]